MRQIHLSSILLVLSLDVTLGQVVTTPPPVVTTPPPVVTTPPPAAITTPPIVILPTAPDTEFFTGEACTSTSAECDFPQTVCGYNSALTKLCQCNIEYGYHMTDGKCLQDVALTEVCDDVNTRCTTPHAECLFESALTGEKRCTCPSPDYVKVAVSDGTYTCAKVLLNAATCVTCEANYGVCYDLPDPTTGLEDGVPDGCQCPPSRSGADCIVLHVHVYCDMTDFTLNVCYLPHDDVDFDNGGMMYSMGYREDLECRGTPASSYTTDICPNDGNTYQRLRLPMTSSELMCGTSETQGDTPTTRRFENLVSCQRNEEDSRPRTFATFCSFDTYASEIFDGIGIQSINDNENGQHHDPDLKLMVLNGIGNPVTPTAPVQASDMLFFRIELQENGYSAIRVERCSVSTSSRLPHTAAVTELIIQDSCPEPGTALITSENTFKRPTPTERTIQQAGPVQVFNLGSGTVYLHCVVRLCLTGAEGECDAVTCPDDTGTGTDGTGTDGTDETGTDGTDGTGTDGTDGTGTDGTGGTGTDGTDDGTGTDGTGGTGTDGTDGTGTDGTDGTGTDGTGGTGNGGLDGAIARRKRREAAHDDYEVSATFSVYNPEAAIADMGGTVTMTTVSFAVIIALLVAVVLISVVMTTILFIRLRSRSSKVEDTTELTTKPQRFALPRVQRSHMRL